MPWILSTFIHENRTRLRNSTFFASGNLKLAVERQKTPRAAIYHHYHLPVVYSIFEVAATYLNLLRIEHNNINNSRYDSEQNCKKFVTIMWVVVTAWLTKGLIYTRPIIKEPWWRKTFHVTAVATKISRVSPGANITWCLLPPHKLPI